MAAASLAMWLACAAAFTQEWAADVDIASLDVAQVRADYSLWTLLSASAAKGSNARSKVQVDAYYINPVTYVHLRGSENGTLKSPERLKAEMKGIYDSFSVVYVLLKTPEDEKLVAGQDWKFKIVTLGKSEFEPRRVEATSPELVFGYSGTFYQTQILLFFDKKTFDVTRGDYLTAANKAGKIKDEAKWVAGAGAERTAAADPRAKLAFKIVVSLLFVVLAAACLITRPSKAWYRKKT